jgi:hypothetical protein
MKAKNSSKSTANRYTSAPVATKPATQPTAKAAVVKVELAPKPAPVMMEIKEKSAEAIVAKTAPFESPRAEKSSSATIPSTAGAVSSVPVAITTVSTVTPMPATAPISAEVSALVTDLRHDDADTARDAATSLGELGNASAVGPLIQVLHNSDGFFHGVVRAAAAASLGKLGDRRAVEALIVAVRDPLAEPSAEAIRALGAIGDRSAIDTLLDVIRNPYGYFLGSARLAAVLALGSFRDDSAMALIRAVGSDPTEEPAIRQAALSCI